MMRRSPLATVASRRAGVPSLRCLPVFPSISTNSSSLQIAQLHRRLVSGYVNKAPRGGSGFVNRTPQSGSGFGGDNGGGAGGSFFDRIKNSRFEDLVGSLAKPQWENKASKLAHFKKDFYVEHPEVANLSADEVTRILDEAQIKVIDSKPGGAAPPRPILEFTHAGLPSAMVDRLARNNITRPSAIQTQAIPIALSGRDMVGRAQTGSGKTLAFALPACVHIGAQPPLVSGDGPVGLVLAPTRELALQIQDEVARYALLPNGSPLRSVCVYGGASKAIQIKDLRRGTVA
jgi:ATP-dependent RNA helicase DDX5/DBP2